MVEISQLEGRDSQNGLLVKESKNQLHELSYTVVKNVSGKTNFRKHIGSFLKNNLINNLILYTHAILLGHSTSRYSSKRNESIYLYKDLKLYSNVYSRFICNSH